MKKEIIIPKQIRMKYYNFCIFLTFVFLTFICSIPRSFSQARLIINSGGYIIMSGGSGGTHLYLVIENNNVTAGVGDGIKRITNGHIISEGEYNRVQWNLGTAIGTFTFPLGKNTTDYVPFVFDKTSAGTQSGTGMVRASSWYTANNTTWPNGTSLCGTTEDNVVDRFWLIDVINYSDNPTASVDFYYNIGEIQTIPETNLQAQRWNSSLAGACKWETPPVGTVNTTNQYVRVSGISSFSPWTLVRQSAPLPIELLEFTVQWKDKEQTSALLHWETASEINNSYFEIQRSEDAVNFDPIGKKQGAGNSSTTINYEYTDIGLPLLQPKDGTVATFYYRLKQMDYDGSFTYSNIQLLDKKFNSLDIISIFPNPSNNEFDYLIFSSEEASLNILVIDATGKVVVSQKEDIKKGINTRRISTSFLSSGNYILQITTGNDTNTEKQFVIQ